MSSIGIYHVLPHFKRHGVDQLVKHMEEYLEGEETVPVTHTNETPRSKEVKFTFSDELMRKFVDDPDSLKKPYEVALKYGFMGNSRGGKNGIFYQRNVDKKMLRQTRALLRKNEGQVMEDLDIGKNGLDELKEVKIVWHNPSGERIVGVYNEPSEKMIFLGYGQY